jgi:hypothetical protein
MLSVGIRPQLDAAHNKSTTILKRNEAPGKHIYALLEVATTVS